VVNRRGLLASLDSKSRQNGNRSRDRGKQQTDSVHATVKPRSNSIAACRRGPNFKSALPLAKEHKQSFANYSKQALLGTRPGRISSAGSEPRDSAFSQRYSPCTPIGLDRSYIHYNYAFNCCGSSARFVKSFFFLGKPSYDQSQTRQSRVGEMSKTTACVAAVREAKRKKAMSGGHLLL
jgi:hypothetical protein